MSQNNRILILHAHPFPRHSRVHRALRQAAEGLANVQIKDLYELYPHFHIAVKQEQEAVNQANIIIFQHPLYWYACPPLMKQWIDDVLENGWAYGDGGIMLHGKFWMQAVSTGGPLLTYHRGGGNRFTLAEFFRPFEQTARLCGMKTLKPFLVPGVSEISDTDLAKEALRYRELLEQMVEQHMPEVYDTLEQGNIF